MGETVEFRALSKNYRIQVAPEHPYFDQNRIARMIPAKIVTFSPAGVFSTSDPEIIAAIRGSASFRSRRVIEISPGDKALFEKQPQPKSVRGVITAASIQEEAGAPVSESVPAAIKLEEKSGPACEVCGKKFDNDPQGRKLRMHKVNHRVSRTPEK